MKKLKVFIEDYGCRPQAMGLPFHYSELGHEVYMLEPREFSSEFDWTKIPTWPRLLHKSDPNSPERNLANSNLEKIIFGEDFFLSSEKEEILKTTYSSKAHVTLVTEEDLKNLGKEIDVYHTTEFCKPVLSERLSWAQKWLPKAKWVSSCVDPADVGKGHIGPNQPENLCIILPSPCEDMFMGQDKNLTYMFRNEFEFDLLGIDKTEKRQKNKIASFMHNFHVRDPGYYDLFCKLQEEFAKHGIEIQNYGGNIRGQGADVRFHKGGQTGVGPSGSSFETLSVRKSAQKYFEIGSVLHLKGLDWGGGVPAHAQMSGTPMITTRAFLEASNYLKYYNMGTGTVECQTVQEIADSISILVQNDQVYEEMSSRMKNLKNIFFTEKYWQNFDKFLNNLR